MAMAFPQLPPWLWRSVEQVNEGRRGSTDSLHVLEEGKASRAAAAAAESGARQQQQQGQQRQRQQARSKRGVMRQRRGSRQWMERQVDQEFDMVLVPSDGCCMSGSESDDSDWSVGWLEPHSSDFSDTEDSFAVLVPCYGSSSPRLAAASLGSNVAGHGEEQNPPAVWAAVLSTLSRRNAAEQRKHVEQWLSSLQQQ